MEFSNHRSLRMADPFRGSVCPSEANGMRSIFWNVPVSVDGFCTTTFRGHAVAVIQGFRAPVEESPRSARNFVTYNLAVAAFKATYVEAMPPVDIMGLQPMENFRCHHHSSKKPAGGHKRSAL